MSPTPGSSGLPKPPHAATPPSSLPNSASAPLPQVNGGFRPPPHQPEASEPLSLCKKRKRKRLGEALRPGSEPGEAEAPPGKRRRKKRRPEDTDSAPLQQGQGQHCSPGHRQEGSVERPASSPEAEGGQQPVNGRGLVKGWLVGCRTDSPHVSKKRRKGVDGLGGEGEARLRQDPPWHR